MKAFNVPEIKPFMQGLLSGNLFTAWQLRSLTLSVLTRIELDGAINGEYLTEEERKARTCPYILWEEIQPKVRTLIAGGHTPTQMDIILAMDPAKVKDMNAEQVESLHLTIHYETVHEEGGKTSQKLTLVTGTSMKTFTLDKTPERTWDEAVPRFFQAKGILITE